MLNECNTCHKPIRWDKAQREKLGIKGPLNENLTAHYCYLDAKVKQTQKINPPKTVENPEIGVGHTHTNDQEILTLKKRVLALENWVKRMNESAMMNL